MRERLPFLALHLLGGAGDATFTFFLSQVSKYFRGYRYARHKDGACARLSRFCVLYS